MDKLKIAAFGGFRCIPPKAGAAGSDKFAFELYPRIAAKGHTMLAYCRIYPGDTDPLHSVYEGVQIKYFKTVKKAGFDTLVHSFKCTMDVIFKNTADVVHLHSGANSIWALLLRLAGKRVVISQFAMDWKRDKWPWYGKLFYIVSNYLTAYCPNAVAFDNVFTKEYFEKKFKRTYAFVPYGSEVKTPPDSTDILDKLGIKKGEYFLFVGRFIPDKGLHILVPAFNNLNTDKKLVLIGGSPNPSEYEASVKNTNDARIVFPGYVYGDDTNILMKNAFAYIQPSLIEGLSPVILTVMGLGTPLICSDIVENKFICRENATTFASGNSSDLTRQMEYVLQNEVTIQSKASDGQSDIKSRFNWDKITDEYIELLNNKKKL
ncbi:glycosyltransferase family 4 protein [Ferruginibacter paludis]|uniref:glycosyltransferase family 4 protein n=1 Tax=Ferruginibacter paludis TaxID=1310417 RepID=UPI0025B55349|nr:glycosyltransferase family 4 protein [Ferruginibacter paludis]MDN3657489.1 glycosyltransferase family 4 protein [Ferruginibacter paludis]